MNIVLPCLKKVARALRFEQLLLLIIEGLDHVLVNNVADYLTVRL